MNRGPELESRSLLRKPRSQSARAPELPAARGRRPILLVASLIATAVLLAGGGCAVNRTPAAASPTLVGLPSDVHDAYLAFWDAWLAANVTADPDEPTLLKRTTDPLLQTLRANLADSRAAGRAARGQVSHHLEGMEIDGDARRVVDCVGLGGWLLFALDTGRQVPDQVTADRSQLTTLVLRQRDGQWKAANMYTGGSCT